MLPIAVWISVFVVATASAWANAVSSDTPGMPVWWRIGWPGLAGLALFASALSIPAILLMRRSFTLLWVAGAVAALALAWWLGAAFANVGYA